MASDEELTLAASVAVLREANANFLDLLADRFDDGRFRSAAALLRGNRAGRPPTLDTEALSYAQRLLRLGIAKSANDAARMTAKIFAPAHYFDATKDRLRKKLRTKLVKSSVSIESTR